MTESKIDEIINKYEGKPGSLIEALLEIQEENHWLPQEVLEKVSQKLNVPLSRVQHTATFYKAFSLVPKAQHKIHVCMGTSCHVRGAARVLDEVQKATGIASGEKDLDSKFSLDTPVCLGCCSAGPVMTVDEEAHEKLDPARVKEILGRYD
jgi:NADH-quinone oxidoreductase subunit E